jgi:hypothetical protein
MMRKQAALATPAVQRFINQPVALLQGHQPFFWRPVIRTFCMPGARAPVRGGGTSHPIPQCQNVHLQFLGYGSNRSVAALQDLRERLLPELDRIRLFRLQLAPLTLLDKEIQRRQMD